MDIEEKRTLFAELGKRLEVEHRTLVAAQKATHAGATHEEARPENDKDTRALEQSYLARGQAERVATLEGDVESLRRIVVRAFTEDARIALGAAVQTEDAQGKLNGYLLSPAGAGEVLASSWGELKVVTPASPLGRALSGQRVDDDVEVRSPTGLRILSIVRLC